MVAVRGVPRLCLDGHPVLPVLFFGNTDIPGERSRAYLQAQVRLAAEHGIHLYSLPLRCPMGPDGETPNFDYADSLLEQYIAADSQALFLLRVYPIPEPGWRLYREMPEGEVSVFADGSHGFISSASEYFRRGSDESLRGIIRHFEDGPLGKRVIGYHPGGPEHEMFADRYRESGPDLSEANQRGFRAWLRARYGSDEALREAWGREEVSLDTATVPVPEPGRFPMHGDAEPIRVFYDLPREQDWVDFSEYCSDLAADHIIRWARIIKAETEGRKLSVFFYGYTMELPGSISGHYRLSRVLACPEVDILAGPWSYAHRRAGSPPAFMSLVDTITAHGKLWINEDDTRTSLINVAEMGQGWEDFNVPIMARDLEETLSVLERNFGATLVHRAGTWWMDLCGAGAFNHPALWSMLRERIPFYQEVYRSPSPFRPQVAVLVDEPSKCYVRSDWSANAWTMHTVRAQVAKTGASVGFYSIDDFAAGLVPPCKAYLFANAFWLSGERLQAIRQRLEREPAMAIWLFAPGYLGPEGPSVERASRLTGMALGVRHGRQGSEGIGLLEGETWGAPLEIVPRLVVTEREAQALGRYRSDGLVSTALVVQGQGRSVFVGDAEINAHLLRKLFQDAGVHLWTQAGDVVQTDGRVLMLHSGEGGVRSVTLPEGVSATAVSGEVVGQEGQVVWVKIPRGGTLWFRLEGG